MKAARIDALAREVIEKAGFGRYFVHSTGHGVGLDIHEMPYISAKSDISVEDGMVFTIEPGIYIPGEFGIRVEDTVVMRRGRAEILGI
jgi:Xaa-Pro aminopeptidase